MKNLIRSGILGLIALAPFAASAAVGGYNGANAQGALQRIGQLISTATPIVVALALLGFFWGLAVYIFNAGNEKKKAQGRNIMIWGILALFVMLSVFGIVGALQTTFGITGNQQIGPGDIPSVNTGTSGYNSYGTYNSGYSGNSASVGNQ